MGFQYKHQDVHLPGERKGNKKPNKNYIFSKEYTFPGETNKPSIFRELFNYGIIILLAVTIGSFINKVLISNAYIPTGSMESTIPVKSRVVGNRLAYNNADPQRGDIIIFHYPDNEEELFIKRIIGLPGETIVITDGKVYIDDAEIPLEEPYLKEAMIGNFGPYTVPEDCYFVMGDNRNDSRDSRYWINKFVSRDKIQSKAIFIWFPYFEILDN